MLTEKILILYRILYWITAVGVILYAYDCRAQPGMPEAADEPEEDGM